MSTPYSKIYERFFPKIDDYIHESLTESELTSIAKVYLKSAVPNFYQCRTDLTRDDSNETFLNTLSEIEEEIISNMMVIEWIKPRINYADLLEKKLSSKDFEEYSSANHIKELRLLKKDIEKEIDEKIAPYGYNKNLGGLS